MNTNIAGIPITINPNNPGIPWNGTSLQHQRLPSLVPDHIAGTAGELIEKLMIRFYQIPFQFLKL